MVPQWDLILYGACAGIDTQTIWHAAALARSRGIQENDILIIDWPKHPFVSCGFNQIMDQVVDIEYCESKNLPVYQRACGGGTVYLDSNQFFYHVITHINSSIVPRHVKSFYAKLLGPAVQTCQHYGINAVYYPANEIRVDGRKISGNAAGLYEEAQALVGNILLEFPYDEMARILKVPNEDFRGTVRRLMESGITSVRNQIGFVPPRNELLQTFVEYFESHLNLQLTPKSLHPETLALMYKLQKTPLKTEWPLSKTPQTQTSIWKVKIHSDAFVVQRSFNTSSGLFRIQCGIQGSFLTEIRIIDKLGKIPSPLLPQLEQHLLQIDLRKVNLPEYIYSFLSRFDIEDLNLLSGDLAQSLFQTYQSISQSP
ncbi:MAG: biotin/lipoate A/B protein ligase family protein [Candidatus Thorarchaeota archaeon]